MFRDGKVCGLRGRGCGIGGFAAKGFGSMSLGFWVEVWYPELKVLGIRVRG